MRFPCLIQVAALSVTVAVLVAVLALSGSAAAQDGLSPQTEMVTMPDGVQLATDIYFPQGDAPWPVLLVRTPYGRDEAGNMAEGLTQNGIVAIGQDVRGRGDSGGTFVPFFNDGTDGRATLDWILAQDWHNGVIATFGGSALGITQYMLAPGAPDALRCQWIEVATPDLYRDTVYQGGAFREELVALWLEALEELDALPALRDHPLNDDYWDAAQIVDDFDRVNVAAFHIGGWHDIFARGTVAGFRGYQEQGGPRAAGRQHLIMGPWTHGTNNPQVGELLFPNGTLDTYEPVLFQWLDACLLDGALGLATLDDLDALPAVTYFTMGAVGEPDAPGNVWQTAEKWPPPHIEIPLYLYRNNYMSVDPPPENGGADTFTYDPADPTPTICGANLNIPAGSCDQRPVERRADVVVYSTMPLPEAVEVTGDLRADIWITTDVPDTDIVVRLTDVYPDGRSMLVADSIVRARYADSPDFSAEKMLTPGEPVKLMVDFGPTSIVFNAGHRIRISITSSNAPRFAPNPNTGTDAVLGEGVTPQIAHTSILHDAEYPSALVLPVR